MASIFFDTCAIEALIKEKNISGNQLKIALFKRGWHAVIGRNTLYECAKNLNNIADVSEKYSFIEELDPEYTLTTQQYYHLEVQKLNNNIPFFWAWAENGEKDFIRKVNSNLKNGIIDPAIAQYHKNRAKEIEYLKKYWGPNRPKLEVVYANDLQRYSKKLYLFLDDSCQLQLFDGTNNQIVPFLQKDLSCYSDVLERIRKEEKILPEQKEQIFKMYALKKNKQFIPIIELKKIKKSLFEEQLKILIECRDNRLNIKDWFKKMNLFIHDKKLETILDCVITGSTDYKALQSCIRTNVWLATHSVCSHEKASRDRFEDALQLTEAAYCTTFVSVEKKLIEDNGFGHKINPFIERLDVKEFLASTKGLLR